MLLGFFQSDITKLQKFILSVQIESRAQKIYPNK